MTVQLSLLEQLCYSTTRIECETSDGKKGTGTGFFFNFNYDGKIVPVVITNRHVAKGMIKGKFRMTKADDQGNPINDQHFTISFDTDFEKMWTFHPDPNIDLCAMPIAVLVNAAKVLGSIVFYRTIDKTIIPTSEQLSELDVVEDILMFGYPNGLWDAHNNMPIIRKGVTATHPSIDYNGKKEFMIDAACFPGSSGSPVFLFNKGGYTTKFGVNMFGQHRLYFLGVLFSGPQHTAVGELQILDVPTVDVPMAISRIPNNLGNVIKSLKILDFEDIFKKMLK